MTKRKPKSADLEYSRGILVTMNAEQIETIKSAVPKGMSSSQWCLAALLEAAKPKPVSADQRQMF